MQENLMITLTSLDGKNHLVKIQNASITELKSALSEQINVKPEFLTLYVGVKKLDDQKDLPKLLSEKQVSFYFSIKKFNLDFQVSNKQKKFDEKTVLAYSLDRDDSINPHGEPFTLELVNNFSELNRVYESRKILNDKKKVEMLDPQTYVTEAGKKKQKNIKKKLKRQKWCC